MGLHESQKDRCTLLTHGSHVETPAFFSPASERLASEPTSQGAAQPMGRNKGALTLGSAKEPSMPLGMEGLGILGHFREWPDPS